MSWRAITFLVVVLSDFQCTSAQVADSKINYPDNQIQSCFSNFASNGGLLGFVNLPSLNDCMQICYNSATCKSILWDSKMCLCTQFSLTTRENPIILLNRSGTSYFEKSCDGKNNIGTATTAPAILPQRQLACQSVSKTAYLLAAGIEITPTSSSITTTYPQENNCISACTEYNNVCWSLNMYPKTKTCIASSQTLPPDGTGVPKPNPESIYLQKFCLPSQASAACAEKFFFLFPQKNLIGNDLSKKTAGTLAECAGNCASTNGCKASVYDSSTNMCFLKSENTLTSGTALSSAPNSVYYFENGCLSANLLNKYRYDERIRQNNAMRLSSPVQSKQLRLTSSNWFG